jgi:site-specific DNA-methyltransferase (adenine-specific)
VTLTLIHGDVLHVLPTLPEASVDAVIADPPYSSGGMFRADRVGRDTAKKYMHSGNPRGWRSFAGDTRDQLGYERWCAMWLADCRRILRRGGYVAVFTDWRQLPAVVSAINAGGLIYRGLIVWDKTEAARPQLGMFRAHSEFVVWASHGPLRRSPGCPPGVIRCRRGESDTHAAQKPVEVVSHLLSLVPPGGTVLDPFLGSGTTAVACRARGLDFVGVEIDTELIETARARIDGHQLDRGGALLQPALEAV